MGVRTYDPSYVSMVWGAIEMQGFAPDAAITVVQDENDWNLQVGVDGEGTRSKTSNNSATVTVSLMQSSPINELISAQRELDRTTPGGIGGQALLIKDQSGTSLHAAETAWVEKAPDAEYNREASVREWTFRTENMISNFGYN